VVRFLLAAASITGASCLVAWRADAAWWSAVLLHAEPLFLVLVGVAVYAALVRRQWGAAMGLVVGTVVAFLVLRLPAGPARLETPAPRWVAQVAGCTSAIPEPTTTLDVLQWRLPSGADPERWLDTLETLGPDVAVLHNLDEPEALAELVARRGGEVHAYPAGGGGPGFGVYTSGEFSLCDREDDWVWGLDTAGGYAFAFVGLGDGTTVPLVVARFPGPFDQPAYARELDLAGAGLQAMLERVQVPTLLVLADGPITDTYRHLLGRFAAVGLRRLALPPNWPVRVGPVPSLPVHAHARAWAGSAWTVQASRRVAVGGGGSAPVWTRLEPALRRASR